MHPVVLNCVPNAIGIRACQKVCFESMMNVAAMLVLGITVRLKIVSIWMLLLLAFLSSIGIALTGIESRLKEVLL